MGWLARECRQAWHKYLQEEIDLAELERRVQTVAHYQPDLFDQDEE